MIRTILSAFAVALFLLMLLYGVPLAECALTGHGCAW